MKKTSRLGTYVGVAVAVAVALAGSASGEGINPDSANWEYGYEGDVQPATEGWVANLTATDGVALMTEGPTDYAKFSFSDPGYFDKGVLWARKRTRRPMAARHTKCG